MGRNGAGNRVRTGDLNLGKVALYQLSYSRIFCKLPQLYSIIRPIVKFSFTPTRSHPLPPAPPVPAMSAFVPPTPSVAAAFAPEDDREFEAVLQRHPADLFAEWFALAQQRETINPEAASLATIGENGFPQVRTVLMKQFSPDAFTFFTNKQSRKGKALAAKPRAAMLFYWRNLGRQISLEGAVSELPRENTRAYFQTRPRDSQIGAWASAQSRPLNSLADLKNAVTSREKEFANAAEIPLPPHWGGFQIAPVRMEFWREGAFRLHRRAAFQKDSTGQWRGTLLQP